jgi:hypothetical protein
MENSKVFWENRFIELFDKDNADKCTVHFEYDSKKIRPIKSPAMGMDIVEVDAYSLIINTFNPKKGASFRLMEVLDCKTEEEAIQKAFQELVSMYKQESYQPYTLEWGKSGQVQILKSYFYAKNEYEVLNRFYAENSPETVTFYSLRVNPIS